MKQNMKKISSIILSVCLIMSLSVTAFAASFSDVPETHWSHTAVETAVERNLVNGYGNGLYGPDDTVSNAEWSQMIANLIITDLPKASSKLTWWYPAVRAMHYSDIWNGTVFMEAGLDYSKPNPYNETLAVTPVNRYDMAQMIYNLSQNADFKFELNVDTTNIATKISDYMNIPVKYRDAVSYCYAAGLIVGVDKKGTFNGAGEMTRGAAATVLVRLSDVLNNNWTIPVS